MFMVLLMTPLNMITIFDSHYILTFFTITIIIEASMNQA